MVVVSFKYARWFPVLIERKSTENNLACFRLACVIFLELVIFRQVWVHVRDELDVSDAVAQATDFQVLFGEGLDVLYFPAPI